MKLHKEFFEPIVDLLQPHMTESGRHTLITPAFSAYDKLYSRIDWSGSSRDFTTRLVAQLAKYGEVEPGQEALILLLETVCGQVGFDVQGQIDEVLSQLDLEVEATQNIHADRLPTWVIEFFNYSWILSLLVTIIVIFALISLFWQDNSPSSTPTDPATPKSRMAIPATDEESINLTPTMTPTEETSEGCEYALIVRDLDTGKAIANAKITLEYQQSIDIESTNQDGYHQGRFQCEDEFPRYRIHIEADDYQSYHAEFTVQQEIEKIYLISTATRFCPHTISVIDRESRRRIADAKIQLEYGPYHTTGYTNSDGYYPSELPCAEKAPSLKIWVYAEGFDPYNINYILQNSIQEIRLPPPVPTPTPTATPIPFSAREEGEILILVVDFWVSEENEDRQRFALRLKDEMVKKLTDHAQIRVEYWTEAISPDQEGRNLSRQIGNYASVDATFVIWGHRQPQVEQWDEEEVSVYLDVVKDELPFLDRRYSEGYLLPSSTFDFATNLGTHWTNLIAFAAGLTLYQKQDHTEAEALFAIATDLANSSATLEADKTILPIVHFYQGMNYLQLGRFPEAETELTRLERDLEISAEDQFSRSVVYSLGLLYGGMDEYERALDYYNQALSLYGVADDRQGERNARLQLALIYKAQDALKQAEKQMRMAIQIGELLDHPDLEMDRQKLVQIQEEIERIEAENALQTP